jgi:hypothetical protein
MAMRELTPTEIADGLRGINDEVLTATQIQALVRKMDSSKIKWRNIKISNKAKYVAEIQKENEKLYFNYPSLFQMHIEDRLDSMFFDMLSLKRKIERGEISEEQATREIGAKMYSRFVPSAGTGNAPVMSYESFYNGSNQ